MISYVRQSESYILVVGKFIFAIWIGLTWVPFHGRPRGLSPWLFLSFFSSPGLSHLWHAWRKLGIHLSPIPVEGGKGCCWSDVRSDLRLCCSSSRSIVLHVPLIKVEDINSCSQSALQRHNQAALRMSPYSPPSDWELKKAIKTAEGVQVCMCLFAS